MVLRTSHFQWVFNISGLNCIGSSKNTAPEMADSGAVPRLRRVDDFCIAATTIYIEEGILDSFFARSTTISDGTPPLFTFS